MSLKIKKVDREIFRLAWPNIISNVSVPLLSSVDTALMGALSAQHLGAVGLGAMIFNFFYWNFGFLRMGTTGMTAQAFGANQSDQWSVVFFRSLVVAGGIAVILLIFQQLISAAGIQVMNASSDLHELIHIYVITRIWAAPATLGLYVLFGWLFGMQNARIPMYVTILINVVNIILSYILIVHWKAGIFGVALGTVLAQYVGLFCTFYFLWWKYRTVLSWPGWSVILETQAFKGFFNINKDIFLRTLCLTFAFGFFYSQSSAFGEVMLGVNVVLLQFLNWMSYGIDGFAFAAESVVGKYYGAKEEEQFKYAVSRVFLWSSILAGFFALIYAVAGMSMFKLFTDAPEIIALAPDYLWWMILLPILGFASYIWDGVYIGMTASVSMRNTMIFSLVFYLLAYYLSLPWLQEHALWAALSFFLVVRGISQHFLFYRYGFELK